MDPLYPNALICPRLKELEQFIYNTPEYVAMNTSTEIQQLNHDLDSILGGAGQWMWPDVYDCVLTAVCAGHPIPSGSNATVLMNDQIFNTLFDKGVYDLGYLYTYNHSEYSKLVMGNIAWHVRQNIQRILQDEDDHNGFWKLALFAGHDTTLMPFLAAVLGDAWDRKWSPYASMITMEIYSAANPTSTRTGYYFRIVYNGKALILPTCEHALCDVQHLLDALSFGQEHMMGCDILSSAESIHAVMDTTDSVGCPVDNATWAILQVFTLVFGMMLGALCSSTFNKWKLYRDFHRPKEQHIQLVQGISSDQNENLLSARNF